MLATNSEVIGIAVLIRFDINKTKLIIYSDSHIS